MKFYESSFEEYLHSNKEYNIHPELDKIYKKLPMNIHELENIIIYGPSGIGKYTQSLKIIQKYSPSNLKYEKKIIANTDKQVYKYKMSDIHYEIDMSMLGCNSKLVWHEIFAQIVDIVSVKSIKVGFILCKNFHLIHSELLDIFYSYIQQYNHSQTNIFLKFILITEHVSFIPNKIINISQILNISRPSREKYYHISLTQPTRSPPLSNEDIIARISNYKNMSNGKNKNILGLINSIDTNGITNMKELKSFNLLYGDNEKIQELPNDHFNIICNKIIENIIIEKDINYIELRDNLYDILTYNLDVIECIWYILSYLVVNQHLDKNDISNICIKTFEYFKYYNNNYRPIYHLESIFYYITIKVHSLNEL